MNGHSFKNKARYYSSVTVIYLVTLLLAFYIFNPPLARPPKVEALKSTPRAVAPPIITAGIPLRIVLPTLELDLAIEVGKYDPVNDSWTLSGYNAHFATITAPANDYADNTFIYGHNNKYVFGHLRFLNPGDPVLVYTDNGLVFHYKYESKLTVSPSDTSVLTYQGPPILTIQTCSGNWDEWREMYKFNFERVGP